MKVMTDIFLADTYALIEFFLGNSNYKRYQDAYILTTKLNIMELHYFLLRQYSKEIADKYLLFYSSSSFVIPVSYSSIKYGMEFKLRHKNEKLSYADCIGYALAIELGIKFLTGDNKFQDKANVEFVK